MSNNDLDPHLIKCIGLMYESKKLRKGDPVPLQYILEEAIFQKTGVVKDYTDFFQSQLPSRESEEPVLVSTVYDDKGNTSENDLELDDLSCVVCNKMDVGARNRLLECSDCHALYHQECHKPVLSEEDIMDTWSCSNCKTVSSKKSKTSEKDHGSSKSSKSDSHRHGSSSSSHKSSSDKYKSSSSSSKSSSSSSKTSSSASPSHSSRSDEKKSSSKSSKSSSSKYYSEKRKHD